MKKESKKSIPMVAASEIGPYLNGKNEVVEEQC
jgi:hypothetical protein